MDLLLSRNNYSTSFVCQTEFSDNQVLQSDLIITVAALTVRNEYCMLVEEAGGLRHVLAAMVSYRQTTTTVFTNPL